MSYRIMLGKKFMETVPADQWPGIIDSCREFLDKVLSSSGQSVSDIVVAAFQYEGDDYAAIGDGENTVKITTMTWEEHTLSAGPFAGRLAKIPKPVMDDDDDDD